jgi:hypothetical protein
MGYLDGIMAIRYVDPKLGPLVRGFGRWRGQIALAADASPVPLILAGWRSAPDPARVLLAHELIARYLDLRPDIARALFEHYAPYVDAIAAGEEPAPDDLPRLTVPDHVWLHVAPVRVLIERMEGRETVEIAYRVAWDEEHTLGACFQDWALTDLNGSILI